MADDQPKQPIEATDSHIKPKGIIARLETSYRQITEKYPAIPYLIKILGFAISSGTAVWRFIKGSAVIVPWILLLIFPIVCFSIDYEKAKRNGFRMFWSAWLVVLLFSVSIVVFGEILLHTASAYRGALSDLQRDSSESNKTFLVQLSAQDSIINNLSAQMVASNASYTASLKQSQRDNDETVQKIEGDCDRQLSEKNAAIGTLTTENARLKTRQDIFASQSANFLNAYTNAASSRQQLDEAAAQLATAVKTLQAAASQLPKVPASHLLADDGMYRLQEKLDFCKPLSGLISVFANGHKPHALADQIRTAFNAVGFHLRQDAWLTVYSDYSPQGVEIVTRAAPDEFLNAALMQLFQEIGQTPKITTDPKLREEMQINTGDENQ